MYVVKSIRKRSGLNLILKNSLTALAFAILLVSCSDTMNPVSDISGSKAGQYRFDSGSLLSEGSSDTQYALINGVYWVTFGGMDYDAQSDQTTFSYTLNRTPGDNTSLNHLYMVIPDFIGEDVFIQPGSGHGDQGEVESNGQIRQIKWNASLGSGSTRNYWVTLSGQFSLGAVTFTARSQGNTVGTNNTVPGPAPYVSCPDVTISGITFVDANENGVMDPEESGFNGVTVWLMQGSEVIATATTVNGVWSFSEVPGCSDYVVTIPSHTDDSSDDINELLFETYLSTTPVSLDISVTDVNSNGHYIGFAPDVQAILDQFESGALLLDTEAPQYWARHLRHAIRRNGNPDFSRSEMSAFLDAVMSLTSQTPFHFENMSEQAKLELALDIVSRPARTTYELLLRQLLAAGLNIVSGKGTGSPAYDMAIYAYANAVILDFSGSAGKSVDGGDSISSVGSTYDLLTSFNRSGGGGGVGTH